MSRSPSTNSGRTRITPWQPRAPEGWMGMPSTDLCGVWK